MAQTAPRSYSSATDRSLEDRSTTASVEPVSAALVLQRPPAASVRRRLAAWCLELGLIVGTGGLLWASGEAVRRVAAPEGQVPVNSTVVTAQSGAARYLGLPKPAPMTRVPPLTNLLWFSAVTVPAALALGQLGWLAIAGKTLPKHWLGLQVISLDQTQPGWLRIVRRELLGRWGLPALAAYALWCGSGAFPQQSLLGGLALLALAAEGATLRLTPSRRALHDYLGGTMVVASLGRALPAARPRLRRSVSAQAVHILTEAGGLTSRVLSPLEVNRGRFWQLGGLLGGGLAVGLLAWGGLQRPQPRDQLFLALVNTLDGSQERQAAALALASSGDQRAASLLVNLLGQTSSPAMLETLQQAIVTLGPQTLPQLQQLNQALAADIAVLPPAQRPQRLLHQQGVKRTLAKLLTLNSGELHGLNLSHTSLGKVVERQDGFELVLEQLDLAGIVWQGSVLSGGRFRQSHFFAAGPDRRAGTYDDWITDFSGSDLTEADFSGAGLQQVLFQGSSLLRATLSQAEAVAADFSQANLGSARLLETNLRQARFDQARLVGADLTDSDLTAASLVAARLHQAQLAGASLVAADLTDIDGPAANFDQADLRRATLLRANLRGSNLQGADLREADLSGAQLQNSSLQGIHLQGANLAGANFEGAVFAAGAAAADSFIEAPPPAQGLLAQVDFSAAQRLSPDQLAYICRQGGLHPTCSNRP
jgi:uncharacterized protein YjbI with pentapeptide repeats